MVTLTINGQTYQYPEIDDENWGAQATGWAEEVTTTLVGMFEPIAGTLAASGQMRLPNTGKIAWRDGVNSADVTLFVDTDDNLYLKVGANPAINLSSTAAGNVTGPLSSTDNAIARYDGTTGQTIQNSGIIIDDTDNITGANVLTATKLVAGNLVPVGSIIPFYDFNALITFDTVYWAYCDGSTVVDAASPINGQTLPDLSGRYLVGFGNSDSTIGRVTSIALAGGGGAGSGYTAGDVVTLSSDGDMNCTVTIVTVSLGVPTSVSILFAGSGYSAANNRPTTGGTGTNFKLNILAVAADMVTTPWSALNVGNTSHQINIAHTHGVTVPAHNHQYALEAGADVSLRFYDSAGLFLGGNTLENLLGSIAAGANRYWGYTGTPFSPSPGQALYTANKSAEVLNTVSSLSSTQSIQPRSVRVRYIMRKV